MATLATSISSVALHLPILAVVARVATVPLALVSAVAPVTAVASIPAITIHPAPPIGAKITAAVTLSTTDADADADPADTDTAAYADLRADHAWTVIDRASIDHPRKNSDHRGTAPDAAAPGVTHETGLFDVLVKNRWGEIGGRQRECSAGKHSSPRESRKY